MAKNKKKERVFGYVRVSTEEQSTEGVSLDAQRDKIKKWVNLHNFNLIEIMDDSGLSGKNLDRPGLQKLIDLVKSSEIETVVVYKLDRLSRKTRDILYLVEEVFQKGNTRFVSITENVDTNSAMGKFFLTMMAGLAQMERELISERTKSALAFKKQMGDRLGTPPYGFKIEGGTFIELPEEQKVIRKMKRLRKKGMSFRKIAKLFNEEKIPPKRAPSWNHSSVHYILKRTSKI